MTHHPELALEQAYLDRAYAHLARMRERTKQVASITGVGGPGGRLRHRPGPPAGAAPHPGHRGRRPHLRAARRRGRRHLVRRPPSRRGRARRSRRHRLAGAGVDALLPGDRRRPDGAASPPAVRDDRPPGRRPLRRGVRRPRQRRRRSPRWHPRPAPGRARALAHRRDARHRRDHRRRAGRGDPSAASTPAWWCRAARAPARPPSGSTGPPSCSSSTGSSSTSEGVLVVGPEPAVPPLHRPGAAVAGRGGDPPDDRRAPRRGSSRRVRTNPTVARLKGDPRMARVLAHGRSAPPQGARARTSRSARPGDACASPAADLAEAVDEITAREVPFAVGRNAFRTRVRRLAWLGHPDSPLAGRRPDGRLRRRDAHQRRAERGRRQDLALAVGPGPRQARPHQQAGARRGGERDPRRRTSRRSSCDAPVQAASTTSRGRSPSWCCVDEAEALLNGVGRTYGHAVVDEAQDLSAMELRAVARRCPSRSMTVLGDLAQATEPAPRPAGRTPSSTSARRRRRRSRSSSSATGCRRPILDVANRLLPAVAPGVRAARSVRVDGRRPRRRVDDAGEDLGGPGGRAGRGRWPSSGARSV